MNKTIPFLALFVIICVTIGCNSTGGIKKPDFSTLLPPGPPAKALAAWDPAVRHTGDEKPQRGFAGRVYFYDREANRPIKIDGSVVVYAFDEENRKSDDNAPTRSYYFAAADMKKLHSKSKLGHSYSLWVPWDTDGPDGKVKKVSLIVRYVPESGSSVVSSQAIVYLPGKSDQSEMLAKEEWERNQNKIDGTIRQVSHLAANGSRQPRPEERLIESNDNRPTAMKTSTISIPNNFSPGMQQAMNGAPPKPAEPRATEIQPVGYVEEKQTASANATPTKDRREAFRQRVLDKPQ